MVLTLGQLFQKIKYFFLAIYLLAKTLHPLSLGGQSLVDKKAKMVIYRHKIRTLYAKVRCEIEFMVKKIIIELCTLTFPIKSKCDEDDEHCNAITHPISDHQSVEGQNICSMDKKLHYSGDDRTVRLSILDGLKYEYISV